VHVYNVLGFSALLMPVCHILAAYLQLEYYINVLPQYSYCMMFRVAVRSQLRFTEREVVTPVSTVLRAGTLDHNYTVDVVLCGCGLLYYFFMP